jgi:hypothetical protein
MNRTHYVLRPGLGDVTSSITDAAVASMTPAIKQIMQEDVLPWLAVSLIAGAVAAAFIGTHVGIRAARAHGGVRRNPAEYAIVGRRRRSA